LSRSTLFPYTPLFRSPRVDLRLHDPAAAAHFARPIDRLLGAVRDAALGNGDPEAREQLFRLVLVDVHGLRPRRGQRWRARAGGEDRKSTRLNSSHLGI